MDKNHRCIFENCVENSRWGRRGKESRGEREEGNKKKREKRKEGERGRGSERLFSKFYCGGNWFEFQICAL